MEIKSKEIEEMDTFAEKEKKKKSSLWDLSLMANG